MTVRNLHHAVAPRSVAVIGASLRPGSVGAIVFDNIIAGGFDGKVWPVNPKYPAIGNHRCYRHVCDLPAVVDLAVIVTPPDTVPGLIDTLGRRGTRAAVVITAGLTAENGLRQAMLDAARPHLFRIIGPNTVGLMVPPVRLNASFAHLAPEPGGIALLSQSGAIVTSLIDWAAERKIGFSHIISLGDMADVDVGDCLDMLAGDIRTKAILMYLESVPEPRKFISAARAAARIKPVLAVKAGRHAEAAKAATTHTGALSGADRVVDAAFRRAGIVRVIELGELFEAAETLSRFRPIESARTVIVTNGGGAGVLAVDQLSDRATPLADLGHDTVARLSEALPHNWSKGNPIDIIGDAPANRYRTAVQAAGEDAGVDALIVMNCPTGLASPKDAAEAVAGLAKNGTVAGKPLITCWLGGKTARAGRGIFAERGIASYDTPAEAARAVSHLKTLAETRRMLMRVPEHGSEDIEGQRETVRAIFRRVATDKRTVLTEIEAKAALAAYGIAVPSTDLVRSPDAVAAAAAPLLEAGGKAVVKLVSKAITHKSDVGGVVLGLTTPEAAADAARRIAANVKTLRPEADIEGFAVQPMIERPRAHELIIGVSRDPIFGPVMLFGAGGTAVEVIDDTAVSLPPLDDVIAGDLIERTRIGRLLAGYRDRPAADRAALLVSLNAVSEMIVEFPCIAALDINPMIADETGTMALDARLVIDPTALDQPGPNPSLAIRPYPADWSRTVHRAGEDYLIRPIKPADVALYGRFLDKVSPRDRRLRFMAQRKHFPEQMLLRLTQLDYNREMAFVALGADGALTGIARLSSDPDHEAAEFAILVRTDLQGRGLGSALLDHLIDYARADGLSRLEGMVLTENDGMLKLARTFGFVRQLDPHDAGLSHVVLDLAATGRHCKPG